jgi:hypothetical protein
MAFAQLGYQCQRAFGNPRLTELAGERTDS